MFRLALTILILLLVAGCGSKGPVKPLLDATPEKVGSVSLLQRGEVMQLAWSAPKRNEDGSSASSLAKFNVYRWLHGLESFCADCRDESTLWRVIDLEYPENVRVAGNRFTLFDFDTIPGQMHRYRIEPVTSGGISGKSVSVSQPFTQPLVAPYVELTVLEGVVRIAWQPYGDEDVVGYRVYRQGEDAYTPSPLFEKPLDGFAYDDLRVESGKSYLYSVRSVDVDGNEGLSSDQIEAQIP